MSSNRIELAPQDYNIHIWGTMFSNKIVKYQPPTNVQPQRLDSMSKAIEPRHTVSNWLETKVPQQIHSTFPKLSNVYKTEYNVQISKSWL